MVGAYASSDLANDLAHLHVLKGSQKEAPRCAEVTVASASSWDARAALPPRPSTTGKMATAICAVLLSAWTPLKSEDVLWKIPWRAFLLREALLELLQAALKRAAAVHDQRIGIHISCVSRNPGNTNTSAWPSVAMQGEAAARRSWPETTWMPLS